MKCSTRSATNGIVTPDTIGDSPAVPVLVLQARAETGLLSTQLCELRLVMQELD
jgi:hypothetical protein